MQPLLVDRFIIIAQRLDPIGRQMAWHDMFDRQFFLIKQLVDIKSLEIAKAFKAFKNIGPVLRAHLVDFALLEFLQELVITRHAPPLNTGQQCVLELADVIRRCPIKADDLLMQGQEYLVQAVCRQVAHHSPEQVGLRRKKHVRNFIPG